MDETEQKLAAVCQTDQPWVDTIRTILEVVLGIPGISGNAFLRHDVQEHFVVEFFAGSYHQFWGLLQPGGRDGHLLRCSSAGKAEIYKPSLILPRKVMRHFVWPQRGLRRIMQRFLANAALQIKGARRRQQRPTVKEGISFDQCRLYRRLLVSGGLVMMYQPIIDLLSGAVVKVEALARLQLQGGALLAPGQFLPWINCLFPEPYGSLWYRSFYTGLGFVEWPFGPCSPSYASGPT